MKKFSRRMVIALVLVLMLLLTTACGDTSTSKNEGSVEGSAESSIEATSTATEAKVFDPFEKMAEPIVFTTGLAVPQDTKLQEGDTFESNDVTRRIQNDLNVSHKVIWTTSDMGYAFETKVNLLIASDDIPDVLKINTDPQGMAILKKLVNSDMIEDMTDYYADYASPNIKYYHDLADNIALNQMTINGKLMAVPSLSDIESLVSFTWIRQDWLDNLGLQGPKTIDDLAMIAKAFMDQDPDGNGESDTKGFSGCLPIYKSQTNSFDTIFNAFQSYPGDWVKEADGKVTYGSIQPQTREALAKLAEWYRDGLIPADFALNDANKASEDIVGGKAGIWYSAWWASWYPLNTCVQNDSKAVWNAYAVSAAADGKCYALGVSPARAFTVVKKGFEHPEAIMKYGNIMQECGLKLNDWYNVLVSTGGNMKVEVVFIALLPWVQNLLMRSLQDGHS